MTQVLQSKLNQTKLPFLLGDENENENENEQEKEKENLLQKFQKEKEIVSNLGETTTNQISTTQEKKKSSSKKINYELNVSALSEDIKDNEKQKISKIYQMMENWEIIIPTLPSLLNRLKLLEIAQNEKKSIIGRIEQLSNSEEIIQKTLLQQSPRVQQINEQLLSNFKYIRDNVEHLEQQFKSFEK
ncbi:dynactin subunit [Anaeramoeba flamelloides]|uniref:Dynactin subunit n=1 Tax=Anaeramoeba flamelloides TaxID=1746091 RepID=A0AAV7Y7U3_9EUKA|nr:dynactin subunit [Anaeramoeba flamelloides]